MLNNQHSPRRSRSSGTTPGGQKRQGGFSLIELLIVVAIIGILVAYAAMRRDPVIRGFTKKVVIGKLNELAELQRIYRASSARGRFGTLAELRAAQTGTGPLMNPNLAPVDGAGQPANQGGWLIREIGTPTNATLQSSFAIEAVPATTNSTETRKFCVFENGPARESAVAGTCDRNSPIVQE